MFTFEIGLWLVHQLVLPFKTVLALLVLLPLLVYFRIYLWIFIKRARWDFDFDYIEPVYQIGVIDILITWTFQIHKIDSLSIYLDLWFLSLLFYNFSSRESMPILLYLYHSLIIFITFNNKKSFKF